MPADIRVAIPAADEDLRLYFDECVENDQFGLALGGIKRPNPGENFVQVRYVVRF